MRLANLHGRLVILTDGEGAVDVAEASSGLFDPDPQAVFDCWDELLAWVGENGTGEGVRFALQDLGPPVPRPRQIFAIGMNYAMHADEIGLPPPERPPVFTKFQSSIAGPFDPVEHPGGNVDWEVEMVVAIGRHAHRVAAGSGWDHVAGVMAGLDISERGLQHEGAEPQYSLGKSYPGFGPIGPFLVTPDELPDRDDLELRCVVNGEAVQSDSTRNMIFSVGELVSLLSSVTPLLPGDLIFTGTPAGVGERQTPPRFLSVGDEVVGFVGGVGEVRNAIVAAGATGLPAAALGGAPASTRAV